MNKSATKTVSKIVFNSLLGLILVIIWLKFVNLQEIISIISKIDQTKILPVFLVMFFSPAIRALRLKMFLSPIKKISLKDMIFLNGVAMLLNFFIPIRAGEIAKGIYLNNMYGLPLGKSVIWIFLDRFIDFFAVLIIAAVLLLIVPTNLPSNSITILIIGVCTVTLITYLMVYQTKLADKMFIFLRHLLILNALKIYFDRLTKFFLETFSILKRKPVELLGLFLVTILAYLADALIFYFGFLALNNHQPLIKMYLGQLLSALTYLIPAAPGYVGSAEAAGTLVFSGALGIEANLASAAVVLNHILAIIFILIYGIISVYFLKINIGSIVKIIFKRGQ